MHDPGTIASPQTAAEGRSAFAGPRAADLRRMGILGVVLAMTALVFVFDVSVDTPLAAGVLYVPLVLTASQFRNPRSVWILAGIACALTLIGYLVPTINL